MTNLFNTFLVEPIFNALIAVYNFLPWQDIGLATIVLTFIIRLVLFPLFHKSARQQVLMNKLQPELAKIQKEHKDNKEKMVKAQMELYKKHGTSPFGSCLVTIIQLPILLAVYRVFLNGFSQERLTDLYNFVAQPQTINALFLGIIDLSKPNIWLAIISAGLQFIATKMVMPPAPKKGSQDENLPGQKLLGSMQKNMGIFAPALTLIVLISLPSILGIYWSATTIFSIIQQWIVNRSLDPKVKIKDIS